MSVHMWIEKNIWDFLPLIFTHSPSLLAYCLSETPNNLDLLIPKAVATQSTGLSLPLGLLIPWG